eukprot:GHVL01023274.1.p1 GENE.GHVL01023274.1~~GHVL01023274.1.p1  ORF type:complete len:1034 (-),score=171.93 GHVL01023274.1:509-3610(-)
MIKILFCLGHILSFVNASAPDFGDNLCYWSEDCQLSIKPAYTPVPEDKFGLSNTADCTDITNTKINKTYAVSATVSITTNSYGNLAICFCKSTVSSPCEDAGTVNWENFTNLVGSVVIRGAMETAMKESCEEGETCFIPLRMYDANKNDKLRIVSGSTCSSTNFESSAPLRERDTFFAFLAPTAGSYSLCWCNGALGLDECVDDASPTLIRLGDLTVVDQLPVDSKTVCFQSTTCEFDSPQDSAADSKIALVKGGDVLCPPSTLQFIGTLKDNIFTLDLSSTADIDTYAVCMCDKEDCSDAANFVERIGSIDILEMPTTLPFLTPIEACSSYVTNILSPQCGFSIANVGNLEAAKDAFIGVPLSQFSSCAGVTYNDRATRYGARYLNNPFISMSFKSAGWMLICHCHTETTECNDYSNTVGVVKVHPSTSVGMNECKTESTTCTAYALPRMPDNHYAIVTSSCSNPIQVDSIPVNPIEVTVDDFMGNGQSLDVQQFTFPMIPEFMTEDIISSICVCKPELSPNDPKYCVNNDAPVKANYIFEIGRIHIKGDAIVDVPDITDKPDENPDSPKDEVTTKPDLPRLMETIECLESKLCTFSLESDDSQTGGRIRMDFNCINPTTTIFDEISVDTNDSGPHSFTPSANTMAEYAYQVCFCNEENCTEWHSIGQLVVTKELPELINANCVIGYNCQVNLAANSLLSSNDRLIAVKTPDENTNSCLDPNPVLASEPVIYNEATHEFTVDVAEATQVSLCVCKDTEESPCVNSDGTTIASNFSKSLGSIILETLPSVPEALPSCEAGTSCEIDLSSSTESPQANDAVALSTQCPPSGDIHVVADVHFFEENESKLAIKSLYPAKEPYLICACNDVDGCGTEASPNYANFKYEMGKISIQSDKPNVGKNTHCIAGQPCVLTNANTDHQISDGSLAVFTNQSCDQISMISDPVTYDTNVNGFIYNADTASNDSMNICMCDPTTHSCDASGAAAGAVLDPKEFDVFLGAVGTRPPVTPIPNPMECYDGQFCDVVPQNYIGETV